MASESYLILSVNAPEGCPHGTHTRGTAYTRGAYSYLIIFLILFSANAIPHGESRVCRPPGNMAMLLLGCSLGMHLDRPIRPRLPAAVAATVAPLLAVVPLPASSAMSDVTLALASRGDGSQGLFASITRDPTDVYYGLVALVGLFYLAKNVAERGPRTLIPPSPDSHLRSSKRRYRSPHRSPHPKQVGSSVIEEAKDADRRGDLANKARDNMKKRSMVSVPPAPCHSLLAGPPWTHGSGPGFLHACFGRAPQPRKTPVAAHGAPVSACHSRRSHRL